MVIHSEKNSLETATDCFKKRGYCVMPHALDAEYVSAINRATDRDIEQNPEMWQARGGGRLQNANVLLSVPELDHTILNPQLLPLIQTLMGETLCFSEYSIMIREPISGQAPKSSWHRDTGHLPQHPLSLLFLSVIYYLTDVDETTHCFGIVPESVQAKQKLPTDKDGQSAIPLHGSAGTAILFNAGSCHDVIYRTSQKERRTIHIYFGHTNQKPLSNYTIFPERLIHAQDKMQHLFKHPNRITQLINSNYKKQRS